MKEELEARRILLKYRSERAINKSSLRKSTTVHDVLEQEKHCWPSREHRNTASPVHVKSAQHIELMEKNKIHLFEIKECIVDTPSMKTSTETRCSKALKKMHHFMTEAL